MINHVNNWEKANKEQNNESVTAELGRYKERVKTFKQRLNIDLSSREKMIDSQMDDMIKEKLVGSSKIFDSNTPVLSPTGLKCSTSNCGSKPSGNCSQLMNFVSKFMGTVRFENDHIARIMGFDDYQLGNVTISRVYYIERLGHNLFFVGQFYDADLEVAFWKNTCIIRNLEGVDLLSGSCKSKKSSHQPKAEDTNQEKLYLFHMDLCGPVRVASINGKRIQCMTPATSSLGLFSNLVSQQPCIPPNRDDWDHLFQPMFDEYFTPLAILVPPFQEEPAPRDVELADSLVSTSIDQDAPSSSTPST
nr:copia protein [Tanacetum cinerariifolium]